MLRDFDAGVSDENLWLSYLSFWMSFVSHNLYTQPRFLLVKELALQANFVFLYVKSVYNDTNEHIYE